MENSNSIYRQHDSFIGKLALKTHAAASQIFILVMTAVIFLEVVRRYFFHAGLTWSQEICGLSFFLLVFLCQANTWQADRHIRMDIFYMNFHAVFRRVSDLLTILGGCLLYGAIAWQGIAELRYQFEVDESTIELMWPLWPFSLVMVFSSLLALALLLRFFALFLTGSIKEGD